MIDLRFYWALLLRRLPVMLALLIICSAFGAVWAIRAPATYSTSAQLLVEAPQIQEGRGGTEVSDTETLQVIEQRLLTRANLIDIANKLNVFPRGNQMTPDEKVEEMRANTRIRRMAGRGQATTMTVSFTSPSPRTAAAVVNEFTTLILSSNTRDRVGRAEERLSFFQQEVERLSADLDQQNARILAFKQANAAALPETLRYSQDRQSLLQERVARLESERATLQAQRADMIRLFEETGSIQRGGVPQTPQEQQLAALQAELNNILTIYNEDSPRVRVLRNRIEALGLSVQTEAGAAADGSGNALLDLNLSQIDTRVGAIDREMEQVNGQLADLQTAITATAANSIALGALERDQANIQARYNTAVANLGSARTSERIEASSRGQRITVIEAASVPSQPSGPNRKKIAAMGVALGLGLAGGLFALLEILNSTIRRPTELRTRLNITPLAVVPYIETRKERRHRQTMGLATIIAVLTLIPLGLWLVHITYMPLDLLAQKIVNRLGLG